MRSRAGWARHSPPARRHSRRRPSAKVTEVGRPPNHAASRACSIARATIPDSRRATCASLGKRFTAAVASTMPTIATTTSTSISVNARSRALIPVADVRRTAFTSPRAVGPEAEDVDLAAHAGAQVLVIGPPRILGQALEIAALLPVGWRGRGGRLLHQCPQPLVGGRIEAIVEPVELE